MAGIEQVSLERSAGRLARRLALSSMRAEREMEEASGRWLGPGPSVTVHLKSLSPPVSSQPFRKKSRLEMIEVILQKKSSTLFPIRLVSKARESRWLSPED